MFTLFPYPKGKKKRTHVRLTRAEKAKIKKALKRKIAVENMVGWHSDDLPPLEYSDPEELAKAAVRSVEKDVENRRRMELEACDTCSYVKVTPEEE